MCRLLIVIGVIVLISVSARRSLNGSSSTELSPSTQRLINPHPDPSLLLPPPHPSSVQQQQVTAYRVEGTAEPDGLVRVHEYTDQGKNVYVGTQEQISALFARFPPSERILCEYYWAEIAWSPGQDPIARIDHAVDWDQLLANTDRPFGSFYEEYRLTVYFESGTKGSAMVPSKVMTAALNAALDHDVLIIRSDPLTH